MRRSQNWAERPRSARPRSGVHSHTMRIAGIEPEWLLKELGHRRKCTLGGEVEIVSEPTLPDEEAGELLCGGDVAASFEGDRGKPSQPSCSNHRDSRS